MKTTLKQLFRYEPFDRLNAKDALLGVFAGESNMAFIAAFIAAYNMRQPTVAEMQGFMDAMMEMCEPIDIDATDAIDIVGTGGDGKNTFNISTLSAIVVAGAGIRVIKHGNYASSSVSGSSNVLESLGYIFTNDRDKLQYQLDVANICFLHAPLFHPAMASVKNVRKELNLQTFFNLLGPLINPASPGFQVLGVSHHRHIKTYQYLLQETGKTYSIVHAMDGYDEISLTGSFKVIQRNKNELYKPADIGMSEVLPEDIDAGDSIADAANIFLRILRGQGTTQQEIVVISNSAFAIQCRQPEKGIDECIEIARVSLYSGSAYHIFKQLISVS